MSVTCASGDCDGQTITWGDGASGDIVWTFDGDGGTDGTITWDVSDDDYDFSTGGSFSGNIGIGTTAPGSLLELYNADATANAIEDMFIIDKQTSGTAASGIEQA